MATDLWRRSRPHLEEVTIAANAQTLEQVCTGASVIGLLAMICVVGAVYATAVAGMRLATGHASATELARIFALPRRP
jgi:hypothetical protein